MSGINLWAPERNHHLISPYSDIAESFIKIMRTEEIMTTPMKF